MAIAQVQGYSFYWSCNKFVINNEYVMPVRRYEKFDQYIYINKMETDVLIAQPDHDKLHKIRPVVNLSLHTFSARYKPNQNQAINWGNCSLPLTIQRKTAHTIKTHPMNEGEGQIY